MGFKSRKTIERFRSIKEDDTYKSCREEIELSRALEDLWFEIEEAISTAADISHHAYILEDIYKLVLDENYKEANKLAENLDTSWKELIPDKLWNFLINGYKP